MKRIFALITVLCLILTTSVALASPDNDIATCADSIIAAASISLNSDGIAYFNVVVYHAAGTISVSSCSLQKLVNGKWTSAGTIAAPSYVRNNTNVYTTTKDYSSYCASGSSYRIIVTYNIDGYTKSYTSNSASY